MNLPVIYFCVILDLGRTQIFAKKPSGDSRLLISGLWHVLTVAEIGRILREKGPGPNFETPLLLPYE
jgi:hypothetical protein